MKKAMLLLTALLVIGCLFVCSLSLTADSTVIENTKNNVNTSCISKGSSAASKTEAGQESSAEPVQPAEPTEPVVPAEPAEPAEPVQPAEPEGNSDIKAEYDFSAPVPKGKMQEKSYFDDAVFVGNSHAVGFGLYSGIEMPVYASTGVNVRSIYKEKCVEGKDGKIIVLDALRQNKDYKKLYIIMGMNELGWKYPEVFIKEYAALIDEIQKINPEAIVYVQSILPISERQSSVAPDENQKKVDIFNGLIEEMCGEHEYYFVDVESALLDDKGYLMADATWDGAHLKNDYYSYWVDYLLSHTLEGIEQAE